MRDDAISVSLGLEGFAVLDTYEVDDQVEVLIELKIGAGVCPGCGRVSTYVHERTDVRVRDLAVHAKPTSTRTANDALRRSYGPVLPPHPRRRAQARHADNRDSAS